MIRLSAIKFCQQITIIIVMFSSLFLLAGCDLTKARHVATYNNFKSKITLDSIAWGDLTIYDFKGQIRRSEAFFPAAIKFLKYGGAFFALDSINNSELLMNLKSNAITSLKLEDFSGALKEPSKFDDELFLFTKSLNIPVELLTRSAECLKEFNNSEVLNTYVFDTKFGNFIDRDYLEDSNKKMNTNIIGKAYATGMFLLDDKHIILWVIVW